MTLFSYTYSAPYKVSITDL